MTVVDLSPEGGADWLFVVAPVGAPVMGDTWGVVVDLGPVAAKSRLVIVTPLRCA